MRKIRIVLVIILGLCITVTAGCSAKISDSAVTASILTGSPNGVWSMLSTGIGEALNKSYPGSVLHSGPGAPVPNLLKLNDNDTEFALINTSNAFEAYRGAGEFDGEKDNISAVAVFYPSVAQLLFRKDIGVSSLEELLEAKIPVNISVGPAESNIDMTFSRILGEYGLTYEDLEAWGCRIYKKGFADTSSMFADEVIDGFFIVAGAPTSFVTQLSVNKDMVMLELEESLLTSMNEKYGHGLMTINSSKYTFMDTDIKTFNSFTMIAASKDVPDETVYKVTKSIYENLDYIKSLHAALKALSPEKLLMESGIPLHPGAEKYYKEIGVID